MSEEEEDDEEEEEGLQKVSCSKAMSKCDCHRSVGRMWWPHPQTFHDTTSIGLPPLFGSCAVGSLKNIFRGRAVEVQPISAEAEALNLFIPMSHQPISIPYPTTAITYLNARAPQFRASSGTTNCSAPCSLCPGFLETNPKISSITCPLGL